MLFSIFDVLVRFMNIATLANTFMPLSAAVTCFLITSLAIYYERHRNISPSVKILWFYFICCMVNWGSVFFYFQAPDVFVVINSLVMFTFIMAQVLFYKFLFFLTHTDAKEHFPRIHYLAPLLITLFLTILMITTPFESQKTTILGRGEYQGGSHLFHIVSNSKMAVRFVFSIIYTALCFIRLHQYRKRIENLSANYDKSSLRWVKTFLLLSLSLIPIPLIGILLPRDMAVSSTLLTAHNAVILFQYAFLCFHVIKQNFISFDHINTLDYEEEEIPTLTHDCPTTRSREENGDDSQKRKPGITREEFEAHMKTQGPFLNPDLRLIDLAAQLKTNRTYLSHFINSEYGINFNRLINRFRMQELERIKKIEANKQRAEKELVEIVGFGSYRNYKRYVSQEDNWL